MSAKLPRVKYDDLLRALKNTLATKNSASAVVISAIVGVTKRRRTLPFCLKHPQNPYESRPFGIFYGNFTFGIK